MKTSAGSSSAPHDLVFEKLAGPFLKDKNVTQMKMFGSPGLRTGGKVFAFVWKGRLVLKLPAPRVQELVGTGHARLFDPGHGRVSKEWVSLGTELKRDWPRLAGEAKEFVVQVSGRQSRRKPSRR